MRVREVRSTFERDQSMAWRQSFGRTAMLSRKRFSRRMMEGLPLRWAKRLPRLSSPKEMASAWLLAARKVRVRMGRSSPQGERSSGAASVSKAMARVSVTAFRSSKRRCSLASWETPLTVAVQGAGGSREIRMVGVVAVSMEMPRTEAMLRLVSVGSRRSETVRGRSEMEVRSGIGFQRNGEKCLGTVANSRLGFAGFGAFWGEDIEDCLRSSSEGSDGNLSVSRGGSTGREGDLRAIAE